MSRKRIKQYLMLLTVVGLIAVAANGSGTFASFSAETTNADNTFATGTLFLHNTANGGTTCTSESSGTNLQTSGCSVLLTPALSASGATRTATLALENAGSLSASDITLFSTNGCTASLATITTTSGTVSSGAQTTIAVAALPQPLFSGNTVKITDGTNTETLTLAADAALGASSIDVTGSSLTNGYASGSSIQLVTNFTSPVTICSHVTVTVQEDANSGFTGPYSDACAFPAGASACTTGTALSAITSTPSTLTLESDGGDGNTGTELSPGGTRYFTLTFTTDDLTNASQNQQATIDLTWHIDQVTS